MSSSSAVAKWVQIASSRRLGLAATERAISSTCSGSVEPSRPIPVSYLTCTPIWPSIAAAWVASETMKAGSQAATSVRAETAISISPGASAPSTSSGTSGRIERTWTPSRAVATAIRSAPERATVLTQCSAPWP